MFIVPFKSRNDPNSCLPPFKSRYIHTNRETTYLPMRKLMEGQGQKLKTKIQKTEKNQKQDNKQREKQNKSPYLNYLKNLTHQVEEDYHHGSI